MNDPDLDRSLIDAARAELGPTEAERRRLRRSVIAAVSAAASATAASATATASALPASAGIAGWKVTALVVAGLSTAVAGGVTWTVTTSDEETSADRASSSDRAETEAPSTSTANTPMAEPEEDERTAPSPDEPSERTPVPPPPDPSADQARGASPASDSRTSVGRTSVGRTSVGRTSVGRANADPPSRTMTAREAATPTALPARDADDHPPATPPSPEHTLIAETALLQSAHRALRGADPERALALLNTHAARYPDGLLGEERAATRVLTLCALERRAEARAEAAAFLAAHPSSMHAPRVRAACAAP